MVAHNFYSHVCTDIDVKQPNIFPPPSFTNPMGKKQKENDQSNM